MAEYTSKVKRRAGLPRFNVGDRVVFRRDIQCDRYWSDLKSTFIAFSPSIERCLELIGYIGTISEVTSAGSYRLEELGHLSHLFADCWVEGLEHLSDISSDELLTLIGGD